MLIDSRTKVLLKNKDRVKEFVTASRIIRDIENSLKETFKEQADAKAINAELDKLIDEKLL